MMKYTRKRIEVCGGEIEVVQISGQHTRKSENCTMTTTTRREISSLRAWEPNACVNRLCVELGYDWLGDSDGGFVSTAGGS